MCYISVREAIAFTISWDVQKLDLCYQISGGGSITTDGTHKLPGCFTSFKWPGKEITAGSSHIDVACRSVCDRDQNGIKRSTFFLAADQGIKTNSERLKSTDQRTFSDT